MLETKQTDSSPLIYLRDLGHEIDNLKLAAKCIRQALEHADLLFGLLESSVNEMDRNSI